MVNARMTPEDYRRRAEWNKNRMISCAKVTTLTGVQHTALAILSAYRHKMHVYSEDFYSGSVEADKVKAFLTGALSTMLRCAGLPELKIDRLFLIPDEEFCRGFTADQVGAAKTACSDEIERYNMVIEKYLRCVDMKYGTWYAPCGGQRRKEAV